MAKEWGIPPSQVEEESWLWAQRWNVLKTESHKGQKAKERQNKKGKGW